MRLPRINLPAHKGTRNRPVRNGGNWPGQAEDSPRLGAGNLPFSCSPRPRPGRARRPTGSGRVLVVTSGCFADTEPERDRSGRRATSAKPDGQEWVESGFSRVSAMLPASLNGSSTDDWPTLREAARDPDETSAVLNSPPRSGRSDAYQAPPR